MCKSYREQRKRSGVDNVEGVETIDEIQLAPHEHQAKEEVEPEGAEDPGDGVEDQLPGDGEVHHDWGPRYLNWIRCNSI